MKLSEFMTRKLKLLSPEDNLQTAGAHMRRAGTCNLPVASDRRLVGMVDQPDPDLQVTRFGHDPSRMKVGDAMNEDAAFCREEDDCDAVLTLMTAKELDCLPVVDGSMRVVGVVHRDELAGLEE